MPWYGWLILAFAAFVAAVAIALRIARLSRRSRRFRTLSARARLDFGRALVAEPSVPVPAKVVLFLLIGYLALPFDLIADSVPVVRRVDDAVVAFMVVAILVLLVRPESFEAALARAEREDQRRRVDHARIASP